MHQLISQIKTLNHSQVFVKYNNLFHDIPINNSVRVDGVVEDIGAVADHKLTSGLQVVLS